jgi:hypothetical protein
MTATAGAGLSAIGTSRPRFRSSCLTKEEKRRKERVDADRGKQIYDVGMVIFSPRLPPAEPSDGGPHAHASGQFQPAVEMAQLTKGAKHLKATEVGKLLTPESGKSLVGARCHDIPSLKALTLTLPRRLQGARQKAFGLKNWTAYWRPGLLLLRPHCKLRVF